MRTRIKQPAAYNYATGVMRVLSEDFPGLADETTRSIVEEAVERHALNPKDTLEVIVDNPTLANWRLKADRNDPCRVRLSCYRFNETDSDRERVQRINTALAALSLR